MLPMLSPELVLRLERYRLGANESAASVRKGPHASRGTGRGMVFADYRDYREGDDLQSVDWRALARLDRLVVRLAREERERPLYVVLDGSASMAFGSPSKFDLACRLAAALSHVALVDLDRVVVFASVDGRIRQLGPLRGRALTHQLMTFLRTLVPGGPTELTACVGPLLARRRGSGMVVLISDFLDPAGFEPALQRLAGQSHDVVVLQLAGPADHTVPEDGELVLVDAESGSSIRRNLSPAIAAAYREAFGAFTAELASACQRRGFRHLRVDVDGADDEGWLRGLARLRVLV